MRIHQLQGYIQSIYLVEYPDKLLLLDGCSRADIPLLKKTICQDLARPLSDLKVVVVTHMHPDHAGAAEKLRQLSGCQIVSAAKEKHWYRGWDGIIMHLTDLALSWWVAHRMGKPFKNLWYKSKLGADIRLIDGEPIPGFDEWCVLETPGHTDRDLSVMHMPSRRIYVADLMVMVKQRFIPPFPVFHPNKYRASLQKITGLRPSSLWLAHGGEVKLSEEDYQYLQSRAPTRPITHLGASKAKIRQIFRL